MDNFEKTIWILIATGIAICFGIWYAQVRIEMSTFNRFSDEQVTFWEAAASDLRITPQ